MQVEALPLLSFLLESIVLPSPELRVVADEHQVC
jgi:hypothetical protein